MIFANILVWMFFSLRSIGKSGFGFWNLDLGFCYRTRNPKRMSLPRNQSPGWIAMKKSESGLHGFPFYCSIGKPEKGFAKLFSWRVVFFLLIIRAWARPLFLRIVFQILFRIFEKKQTKQNKKQNKIKHKKKGKERKSKERYLSFETRFQMLRSIAKSEIRIFKPKSRFPNHPAHPRYSCLVFWNLRHWG